MDNGRNRVDERQYPMEDAPVVPGGTPSSTPGGVQSAPSTAWPGAVDPAREAARYTQAQRRVRQKRDFYRNLTSYVFVNLLLFLINLFTSPGEWWFYWVLIGWGIGILAQARNVFAPRFDSDWEERQIQAELRKNR